MSATGQSKVNSKITQQINTVYTITINTVVVIYRWIDKSEWIWRYRESEIFDRAM